MKRSFATIIALLLTTLLYSQQCTWEQKTTFPSSGRHGPVGFAIDGICYFGLGQDANIVTHNDFWSYDPATGTWTLLAPFPGVSRLGASAFVLDGYGYVCCGWSSTAVTAVALNDCWRYDPRNNSWSPAASLPGVGRYTACSFVIGSYAYVGTGKGAGGPNLQNDFYRYDPRVNTWSPIASYPLALQSAAAFSLNGTGYVAGGHISGTVSDVYAYDPLNNTWTAKNHLPSGLAGSFSFVVNDIPFLGCGLTQVSPSLVYTNNVYLYDAALDSWILADTFPAVSRSTAACASTGQEAYLFGGNHQTSVINPINELWKYYTPLNIPVSGPASFCSGSSATLSVHPEPGYTYQWQLNNADIPGATASVYVATQSGAYACIVSSVCNRSSSNILYVDELYPPAAPSISSSDPLIFCSGGSALLEIAAQTGNSYQWKLNGVDVPDATGTFYAAVASGDYSCQVTNLCGSDGSNTLSVVVAVAVAAPGPITGQTNGVCLSSRSYTIAAVSGASNYNWTAPVGASIYSGQGSTSVTVAFSSSFSSGDLAVTADNACGISSATALAIEALPDMPGTISGPASVCKKQSNVQYSIAAVAGATSYTWSLPPGAQVSSGQGGLSIRVKFANQSGSVSVKANNGCGSSLVRTLPVAITCREMEAYAGPEATIFPNPTAGEFRLIVHSEDPTRMILHDLTGKIVSQEELIVPDQEFVFGSTLAPGIYLVEIKGVEFRQTFRIVKN